ncbi:PP2C family protein-serine/threonine phosphatase [Mycobacterium sp.]|uniref:PP2C family protein-serine/threonine phosphatase n=1 Tax=Mycobacterium sp. TaxID=1785 RepID=UPI002CAB30DF|nr:protein phosphatase 2C domain-containing protein [Mycobacterium sp.]HTQ16660.1 protein phosphatase 2C domain-containing protein [Mycobacterium sp.]
MNRSFFRRAQRGDGPAVGAVDYAGLSDIGQQRSFNQDRWGVDPDRRLFVVADGVASSSHGELAAQTVVELLPAYVARHLNSAELQDTSAPSRLGDAIAQLSDDLRVRGDGDPRFAGASTTVVTAVIAGSRMLVAHLGDSRAYLYRAQQLRCLTRDHSLLQTLIDMQKVSAEDASVSPVRNVLTRHVGMAPPALPDVSAVEVQPGDRILLCSDGLVCVVNDESLTLILGAARQPGTVCKALIDAANGAGGPDNITALVIDVASTNTNQSCRAAAGVVKSLTSQSRQRSCHRSNSTKTTAPKHH